ncbi:hypothetical protein vBAspABolek_11 [Aeromonas phage vB_AspA_Bolek]|nr:hypothetical protein vBAspABolek_11 [Aeromonas phage vB_AspA_Bolek]
MLKRKRKINKAILIANSRGYTGPMPKAYASLLRCGTEPELAQRMVQEVWSKGNHSGDDANVWGLCVWSCTGYESDWQRAGLQLDRLKGSRQ